MPRGGAQKRRFSIVDHQRCGQLLNDAEGLLWEVLETALRVYPQGDLEGLERLVRDRGVIWRVRNRLDTHYWQEVARGDLPRPKVMGTSPYYPQHAERNGDHAGVEDDAL